MKKLVAAILLSTSLGCFGSFTAVQKVYGFNAELSDNKFVQTIVMYGLVILPAYTIAVYADVLLLNVIEFWTGDNPLAANESASDTRLATIKPEPSDDGSVAFVVQGRRYVLKPIDETHIAVLMDGQLVGITRIHEDGSLELQDADGKLVRTIPADEVSRLQASAVPMLMTN